MQVNAAVVRAARAPMSLETLDLDDVRENEILVRLTATGICHTDLAMRDQAFPVDGGVFDVNSNGEVVVAITPKLRVNDLGMFAVTVEKPGGVVVSKRERIVVTATRT